MAADDEDEIIHVDTDTNDDDAAGGGATGQDAGGGNENPELSAEQLEQPGSRESGDEQPVGDEQPARSRASARFERLSNDNRELRARLERIERERQEDQRRQWASQQHLTEQQERERFALMTDAEKADYRISKMESSLRQQTTQATMQMQIMADKIAFDAKASVHPVYGKYKDEVEAKFQEQLAKGLPVEREIILENILGKRAIAQALNGGRARRQAATRVANEQVNAASGKGDTAAQRGKAGDTPEKRLQGVSI